MILLAVLAALLAQDAPDISGEPACRGDETIPATLAEIASHPGRYVERCVRVSGLLYQNVLHDGRDGLYLARLNSWDGGLLRSHPERHLLLTGPRRRPSDAPVPATVVGRIDTCQQRERRGAVQMRMQAGPDDIILASYHCYAANGVMLAASEVSTRHARIERLTGESARARYGNLTPMPASWPQRERLESLVQTFLLALRSGDRDQAGRVHGIRPGSRASRGEEGRRLFAYLFDDLDSPFAPLRRAAPSQIAYYVPRLDQPQGAGPRDHAVIACFCRTDDCRDRWPLSTLDIRNQPGRPYVCTRIMPRDWVANGAELETDLDPSGPAEPARTAAP